jgi:hypothetical protein
MHGRRAFGVALARGLLVAGVAELLRRPASASAAASVSAGPGLRGRLEASSSALRRGALHQRRWQAEVAALVAEIDPAEVIAALALGPSVAALAAIEARPRVLRLGGAESEAPAGIRHRIFTFRRGQAVVPHGHDNLVSVFIALEGRVRARHFDRVADRPREVVIRPTIDRTLGPGEHTSISDYHDNVHWLTADDGDALVYSLSVDAGAGARRPGRHAGRIYLDPDGVRLGDGSILAAKTDRLVLERKYDG